MSGERLSVIAVVAGAFTGASLAASIMWYMTVFDGFDYTRESWYAIPALWGCLLLALWVAAQQRLVGGIALLLAAYLVSTYFADVYGYVPGAVVAVVALNFMWCDVLRWTNGRLHADRGSERA